MKILVITAGFAFLLFAVAAAPFAGAAPMTNGDVINLAKAGMSEAVILSAIDVSEPHFDTSAQALVDLKKAGVSEAVIERMIARKSGHAAGPQQAGKHGPCKLAASEELQPVMDGTRQVNLGYREADIDEDISAGSTIANVFTLGVAPAKGTLSARVSGKSSRHRIRSKTPIFLDLGTLEGQSPEDAFALVRLEVKGSDRILVIGETSASLFGGYRDKAKFKDGTQVPLKLEKVQENCTFKGETLTIYRGVPTTPLAPGEYALLYGERFYDFAIDP